jgi:site-specific DNA recombinase
MKTDQNILLEQFGRGKLTVSERSNNCVIYTRVSTKEQADNNMSLETQRKACEQFALKNGYSIMGTFGGTYESAKTDERKEFNRMLSFVKRTKEKICYIIVYSVDRFSRSGANAIYIKEQLRGQGILIMAVSQPTDSATPSGSLQQNIQFIFSEYDNQLRREKCIAGTKEALMRGEWCSAIPVGYDREYTNGKRSIIINKDGKLFRKAFLWKANEGISNEEIKKRLEALGLKLTHQRISEALRNPFYCGMMAHRLLEGKLIEGSHEKLISRELFLKANEILSENPRGYTCNPENEKVPLKVYLKCECCGSIMSGYIVKAKNLWYYKCKKKGCGNNKSANQLHGTFTEILASMMVKPKYRTLLKTQMIRTFNKSNKENAANAALLKRNYEDISHKIERLEERYVLEEITQDIYLKYRERFKQERLEIYQRLQESSSHRSNLEEIVETVLDYAGKLPETWVDSPFAGKQKLQNVVFPAGITYNKKTDQVRTTLLNPTFCWIAQQQQEAGHEKSGISHLGLSYAALVENTGVEPVTFCMPCKRSSQLS